MRTLIFILHGLFWLLLVSNIVLFMFGRVEGSFCTIFGIIALVASKYNFEPRCREMCELMRNALVNSLKKRAYGVMKQGVEVAAGAYGTYVRFTVPAEFHYLISQTH